MANILFVTAFLCISLVFQGTEAQFIAVIGCENKCLDDCSDCQLDSFIQYSPCSYGCVVDGVYTYNTEPDFINCGTDKVCYQGQCRVLTNSAVCSNLYGFDYIGLEDQYNDCSFTCVSLSGDCRIYDEDISDGVTCFTGYSGYLGTCQSGACVSYHGNGGGYSAFGGPAEVVSPPGAAATPRGYVSFGQAVASASGISVYDPYGPVSPLLTFGSRRRAFSSARASSGASAGPGGTAVTATSAAAAAATGPGGAAATVASAAAAAATSSQDPSATGSATASATSTSSEGSSGGFANSASATATATSNSATNSVGPVASSTGSSAAGSNAASGSGFNNAPNDYYSYDYLVPDYGGSVNYGSSASSAAESSVVSSVNGGTATASSATSTVTSSSGRYRGLYDYLYDYPSPNYGPASIAYPGPGVNYPGSYDYLGSYDYPSLYGGLGNSGFGASNAAASAVGSAGGPFGGTTSGASAASNAGYNRGYLPQYGYLSPYDYVGLGRADSSASSVSGASVNRPGGFPRGATQANAVANSRAYSLGGLGNSVSSTANAGAFSQAAGGPGGFASTSANARANSLVTSRGRRGAEEKSK